MSTIRREDFIVHHEKEEEIITAVTWTLTMMGRLYRWVLCYLFFSKMSDIT